MSSVLMPKAAKAAVVVASLIAVLSALSVSTGPIMLLGVTLAALVCDVGLLRRQVWSAYGFAALMILSILAILFFAITGQNSGNFIQVLISVVLYSLLAGLFLLAGHMLATSGAKRGSPAVWILIALLFSVPFVVYHPVTMQSNAMENTVMPGDFLLVDRFAKAQPERGEVVAFRFPSDPRQVLVRRIAGLPGDRIRFVSGTLYRNGQAVPEPYLTHNQPAPKDTEEVLVPANKSYVLGDARANSLDSRQWGFVDLTEILGPPKFIYDSLAPDPADLKPADAKTGDKYLVEPGHAPVRRWERVFKIFKNGALQPIF